MTISITDAVPETYIFIAAFLIIFLLLIRKQKSQEFFPVAVSQELKGLAILMIVFSHIGYFLFNDHRFLFPLSVAAGVGVDLFLLLSGYGLAISAFGKDLSVRQFYKKRLLRLFVPFWIVVGILFTFDFFLLHKSYGAGYIISSILGFFPHADLFADLNSPLWYFTFILMFYILFPLLFRKRYYWLSALAIYVAAYEFTNHGSQYFMNVVHLYKLHLFAFPLGVILAGIVSGRQKLGAWTDSLKIFSENKLVHYLSLIILTIITFYYSYHSGVGKAPLYEETISLLVAFSILGIFLIKKADLRLLSIFGLYSYEIYLFHWPILYRYDIFYKYMPAAFATILYLLLFLGLGWTFKKIECYCDHALK